MFWRVADESYTLAVCRHHRPLGRTHSAPLPLGHPGFQQTAAPANTPQQQQQQSLLLQQQHDQYLKENQKLYLKQVRKLFIKGQERKL